MTEERMRALKYPNDIVDDVVKLVYLHLRIHTYAMGWTDKAVRRYVRDAGDLLEQLNHLQRCDCTTRNQNCARALRLNAKFQSSSVACSTVPLCTNPAQLKRTSMAGICETTFWIAALSSTSSCMARTLATPS